MTVKELIDLLLEKKMDSEVVIQAEGQLTKPNTVIQYDGITTLIDCD